MNTSDDKKWVRKQKELQSQYSSFHWGLTLLAVVILVLLAVFFFK